MRWNLHYPRLQRTVLSLAIRVYPASLGCDGPAMRPGFANGRYASANIQPAILLKEAEQVIGVGNLARDDLLLSLVINHGKGNLHGLVRGVLFGKVDQFYVESFLLLRLHWHCFSLVPGWDCFQSRKASEPVNQKLAHLCQKVFITDRIFLRYFP